jgi:NTE family protein
MTFFLVLFFLSNTYAQEIPRPKVGLVLAGGGAKGFAHIGTLKLIDSLHIPIDYIAGTSMGGIVGALYAIGYDGLTLEKLSFATDWQEIFTDIPPRRDLPYFLKKETGKYQVNFAVQGIKPAAPSGLIFGQKITLLFSSLTYPYEKVSDFDDLPVPVRLIAVDLPTGQQVTLCKGSLAKAMRATMSIPTVFSPVEWGDSLLVDGGLLNNFPVNIVKEMGADLVIGVDLATPLKDRQQLRDGLAVLNQSLAIFDRTRREQQKKLCDVYIQPDLGEFTPADFDNEKIEIILKRGDLAAQYHLEELIALRDRLLGPDMNRQNPQQRFKVNEIRWTGHSPLSHDELLKMTTLNFDQPMNERDLQRGFANLKSSPWFSEIDYELVPLKDHSVLLNIILKEKEKMVIFGLNIIGNKKLPFAFINRLLGLAPGDSITTEALNNRIMDMYGLGYFESIHYEIHAEENNYITLDLIVKELPMRRLNIGLRYDDRHKLVAAVGLQATNLLLPGLRLETDLQFAGLFRFSTQIAYPSRTLDLPVYPYLRIAYKDIPVHIFGIGGDKIARYNDKVTTQAGGIGILLGNSLHAEMELQRQLTDIEPSIAFSDPAMFPEWKDRLHNFKGTFIFDTIDNVLLARKGWSLQATFDASLASLNSDAPFKQFYFSLDHYQTWYDHHTLRFHSFVGSSSHDLPPYRVFVRGHPREFVGLEYDQLQTSDLVVLRLDYRYEYRKDIFLKAIINAVPRFYSEYTQTWKRDIFGFGIGIKLLSPIGPIEIISGWGDKDLHHPGTKQHVIYFILGTVF